MKLNDALKLDAERDGLRVRSADPAIAKTSPCNSILLQTEGI